MLACRPAPVSELVLAVFSGSAAIHNCPYSTVVIRPVALCAYGFVRVLPRSTSVITPCLHRAVTPADSSGVMCKQSTFLLPALGWMGNTPATHNPVNALACKSVSTKPWLECRGMGPCGQWPHVLALPMVTAMCFQGAATGLLSCCNIMTWPSAVAVPVCCSCQANKGCRDGILEVGAHGYQRAEGNAPVQVWCCLASQRLAWALLMAACQVTAVASRCGLS